MIESNRGNWTHFDDGWSKFSLISRRNSASTLTMMNSLAEKTRTRGRRKERDLSRTRKCQCATSSPVIACVDCELVAVCGELQDGEFAVRRRFIHNIYCSSFNIFILQKLCPFKDQYINSLCIWSALWIFYVCPSIRVRFAVNSIIQQHSFLDVATVHSSKCLIRRNRVRARPIRRINNIFSLTAHELVEKTVRERKKTSILN